MNELRRPGSLPLFDPALPAARLLQIPGGATRRFSSGHVLARQGDVPDRLDVIQAGAICLSSVRDSGRRAVLDVLGPGDLFGLAGLWRGAHVPAEARAMVPSVTLSVPLAGLAVAMASHSDLAHWVVVSATRWQDRLQRHLARILTRSVQERVVGVLVDLATMHGRAVPGGTRLDLPVTQDLVAAMVGATRESVNRALRSLAQAGTVRRSGGSYELCGDQLPEPGSS